MTKIQRITIIILFVSALLMFVIGFLKFPISNLLATLSLILASLFSIWWPQLRKKYARKRLEGRISFDYSNNNGKYIIGKDDLLFETKWSKASDTSIHIYNDPPSIAGVSVVQNKPNISDIRDAGDFDFSSRTRTAEEGDIIILKNKYDNYAILKVTDIKYKSRSDVTYEVTFEYVINPDGKSDFR